MCVCVCMNVCTYMCVCVCACVCVCVRFIFKTIQTVSRSYIRGFILSAAIQLSVRLTSDLTTSRNQQRSFSEHHNGSATPESTYFYHGTRTFTAAWHLLMPTKCTLLCIQFVLKRVWCHKECTEWKTFKITDVHCSVHNSPPLVPIWSQLHLVYTLILNFFNI
jgi:hypothetical protein